MTRSKRAKKQRAPTLRFSPYAWAKLLYLRDYGDTEVGGFGITPSDDLLFVEDVRLVQQTCTWAHVAFDDAAVADFFDEQVDAGRQPEQFLRIWIHTHPGNCPQPSGVDEATYARVFGQSSWAVMFILACGGRSYARLRLNAGPGAELELPVEVSYERPFDAFDGEAWENEYLACVQRVEPERTDTSPQLNSILPIDERLEHCWQDEWIDYLEQQEDFLQEQTR